MAKFVSASVSGDCRIGRCAGFLPAAGYRNGGSLNNAGDNGNYWSGSLNTDNPNNAWNVNFNSDNVNRNNNNRYNGQSVRPVLFGSIWFVQFDFFAEKKAFFEKEKNV